MHSQYGAPRSFLPALENAPAVGVPLRRAPKLVRRDGRVTSKRTAWSEATCPYWLLTCLRWACSVEVVFEDKLAVLLEHGTANFL